MTNAADVGSSVNDLLKSLPTWSEQEQCVCLSMQSALNPGLGVLTLILFK